MGRIRITFRRSVALCFLLLLGVTGQLQAQNYDNPGLGEQPVSGHPQDYKPLGIRAGSFMLHPGVQLAAQFTDNVFYTRENKQDDLVWHFRPYITAQSNWSRHSFNLRLAADIARHQDYSFRDYEDYFLLINGRMDVKSRNYFSYSLDYMNLHESLGSRDAQQGIEPTRYDMYGGSLGYDHHFNRLSLGLLYQLRRLDFDDVLVVGEDGLEPLSNDDRDRDDSTASVRLGYQFKTDKQAFLRLNSRKVEYEQPLDRNGFHRNSDGWSANAGVNFTMTGKLNGDLYVSYHDRSYDDPRLAGVSGWAGGAGLRWTPTQKTGVGARINSSIQETTYEYSSGYLMTLYSLRVDHELTRSLQVSGFLSYRDNDYQLIEGAPEDARSKDEMWQAGLGLNYFVNRHVFFSAAYTYGQLRSNIPGDGYDVNRIWLTFSLEK